jgi:GlcNAc-P-P-Und epimerase
VVFGERNRGNVFNLLRQIASGRFLMIGAGTNRKSLAYVENVAAFIVHSLDMSAGVHVFNYVDKPDFTMNAFVELVQTLMGKKSKLGIRIPKSIGLAGGILADIVSRTIGKNLPISQVRVRKFCANSVYDTAAFRSGFKPPVALEEGLKNTVRFEFLNKIDDGRTFQTE